MFTSSSDCAYVLLQRHDQQAFWPRGTWAEGGQTEAAGGADSRGRSDSQGENAWMRVSHGDGLMLADIVWLVSRRSHVLCWFKDSSFAFFVFVLYLICFTAESMLKGRGWTCSASRSRKTKICGKRSLTMLSCKSACAKRYRAAHLLSEGYRTVVVMFMIKVFVFFLTCCREYKCGAMPKNVSSRCKAEAIFKGFPPSVMLSRGCWEMMAVSSGWDLRTTAVK